MHDDGQTLEQRWAERWRSADTYRCAGDGPVFAIDTPPPSVCGRRPRLTHVLTYVQVDVYARYQRMCGRPVLFPVGWDDGDSDLGAPDVPRLAALRAAGERTERDGSVFEQLWRTLGISVDWSARYTTLGACAVSQRAFLRDLADGLVRRGPTPAWRDPDCAEVIDPGDASRRADGWVRPGCGHRLVPAQRSAWQLRIGGRKDELRALGAAMRWHPPHMRARFDDIVRTRVRDVPLSLPGRAGIPVPLWYPVDRDGRPDHSRPIRPEVLPVDPEVDVPPGRSGAERNRPGGFTADNEVLHPLATSSLTPAIAAGWGTDPDRFATAFPMAVRPQGHYIIQSWLLTSLMRGYGGPRPPWSSVLLSGFLRGPGPDPFDALRRFGGDGVRYWAALSAPGRDVRPDPGRMRRGRRIAAALLRLCRIASTTRTGSRESAVDRSLGRHLSVVTEQVTGHLEGVRHDQALRTAERALGLVRTGYLPLVRHRPSALRGAVDTLLLLLAPFLPFVCAEGWWVLNGGCVHTAAWPTPSDRGGDPAVLTAAAEVLAAHRRAGSPGGALMVTGPPALAAAEADLLTALGGGPLTFHQGAVAGLIGHPPGRRSPRYHSGHERGSRASDPHLSA